MKTYWILNPLRIRNTVTDGSLTYPERNVLILICESILWLSTPWEICIEQNIAQWFPIFYNLIPYLIQRHANKRKVVLAGKFYEETVLPFEPNIKKNFVWFTVLLKVNSWFFLAFWNVKTVSGLFFLLTFRTTRLQDLPFWEIKFKLTLIFFREGNKNPENQIRDSDRS